MYELLLPLALNFSNWVEFEIPQSTTILQLGFARRCLFLLNWSWTWLAAYDIPRYQITTNRTTKEFWLKSDVPKLWASELSFPPTYLYRLCTMALRLHFKFLYLSGSDWMAPTRHIHDFFGLLRWGVSSMFFSICYGVFLIGLSRFCSAFLKDLSNKVPSERSRLRQDEEKIWYEKLLTSTVWLRTRDFISRYSSFWICYLAFRFFFPLRRIRLS